MRKRLLGILMLLSMCGSLWAADSWIRINQLGYLPDTAKAAVLISTEDLSIGPFQNGKAVYHDDMGDYASNEPTIDGTASLSFYLSSMEKQGHRKQARHVVDTEGTTVRMDPAGND